MIDLDALQKLAAAATPGPWAYQEDSDAYTHIVRPVASPGWIIASATQTSKPEGEANGRFIAAANPSVILDLIGIARAAADSLPKIKEGATPKPDAWKYRAIGNGEWRVTLNEDWARALNDPNVVPLFAGAAPASQAAEPQEPNAVRVGRIVAVQEGSADVELECDVRVGDVVYSGVIDQRIKEKLAQFGEESFRAAQHANSVAAQWGLAQIEIAELRNYLNGALGKPIHQVAMPNALGDLRWYDVQQSDYDASLPHLRRVVHVAPTPREAT